jgi:hypothetical protein
MRRQKLGRLEHVREGNAWKLAAEQYNDGPIDLAALYAMLPARGAAFSRGGSPWNSIAHAPVNTKRFPPDDLSWKLQATRDEEFVYVRLEASKPIPLWLSRNSS